MDVPLKYGCNPHQTPASLGMDDEPPLEILNGRPSYINILDALAGWQLVTELKAATGKPAAASFKHVSPAGAAVSRPISASYAASQFIGATDLAPVALAYVRARSGDRLCAFGDAAAVSDPVEVSLAEVLRREVSDLVIAPAYEAAALEILKRKKNGAYLVLRLSPDYRPPATEAREIFGFRLRQKRNDAAIGPELFRRVVTGSAEQIPNEAVETLIVATVALKYTQSDSMCVAWDGQVVGMGAGQQSRVHCTRLACDKADKWFLQLHPKTLALAFRPGLSRTDKANLVDQYLLWDRLSERERRFLLEGLTKRPEPITAGEREEWIRRFAGVCLSSDAYIPFRDSLDRAARSNVRYVAQTGGSLRDDEVMRAAAEYGMTMVHTGLRLFTH
jgi:phosphoribosylaminoimidazolecarboxamide formyltransferase/IMP cyclohydrolase